MNYKISLDIGRTASDADIRKTLKLSAEHVITRHDVIRFARHWQNLVAGTNDGSELIANADVEVGVLFQ